MIKKNITNGISAKRLQNQPENGITPSSVCDFQGNKFLNENHKQQVYKTCRTKFSSEMNPNFDPTKNSLKSTNFLTFSEYQYFPVFQAHFQLHDCMKLIGNDHLLYTSNSGISMAKFNQNHSRLIYPSDKIFSFDIDSSLQFISGVEQLSGNFLFEKNKTFLFDVKSKKQLFKKPVYDINNIIGKISFVNVNNQIRLFASGNAGYGSIIDFEKDFKETKVNTTIFINNHDFDKDSGLIGMSLDNGALHFADLRSKTTAINIAKAHQGYALPIKSIGDYEWASGGQDFFLKIFDIRNFVNPVFISPELESIPAKIQNYYKSKAIFVLGMNFVMDCFFKEENEMCQQKIEFIGPSGSIDVDQTKSILYLSTVLGQKSGIGKFEFRNN